MRQQRVVWLETWLETLLAGRVIYAFGLCYFHAVTCFGCREIISVISAATIHSAPAAKNAGRYVASAVRDKPAPNAAIAAPSWTDISPDLDAPFGALALDGQDTPTTIYVGTDVGGVLRSVDLGATWTVLDDLHFPGHRSPTW